ncbi:MAG: hypothetical protein PHU44_02640 [Syntrophales bacterium]|nr:hypothetical protein [Syntrophales bacterium]MDD5640197.1 hypothetical protein [Syntrophales bacterium]
MSNWSPAELTAALEAVDRKAAVDAEFKKKALLQPREALQEATGREVPQGPVLEVFDFDLYFDTAPLAPPPTKAEHLKARLDKIGALIFPEAAESGG